MPSFSTILTTLTVGTQLGGLALRAKITQHDENDEWVVGWEWWCMFEKVLEREMPMRKESSDSLAASLFRKS